MNTVIYFESIPHSQLLLCSQIGQLYNPIHIREKYEIVLTFKKREKEIRKSSEINEYGGGFCF